MERGARFYYRYRRLVKTLQIYLVLAGPGIIVMVADNDAGGITTYSVTGSTYGCSLIWFLILLGPIAYFVQEMTVRLGAVTKRGHAEAIFDAFGSFWGWFSLGDLALTDWLTLITEYIGMTAAPPTAGPRKRRSRPQTSSPGSMSHRSRHRSPRSRARSSSRCSGRSSRRCSRSTWPT